MPKEFSVKSVKIGNEIFKDVTVTVSLKRSVSVRMWIASKLVWLAVKIIGANYKEEVEPCQE